MALTNSFKFVDDELNRKLIGRLKKAGIKHVVDKDGVIHYSAREEDSLENDLLQAIRCEVFPSWQVLSCPENWTDSYRAYMLEHDVPFAEELIDGRLCFLLPRRYRPDAWRIEEPSAKEVHVAR